MRVIVCDVGPRDGLQNEPESLAPAVRADLVDRLAAAGLPRIEAVSFVRDERVPQMAGAEEVVAKANGDGAELSGLVLNDRGWERFRATDLDRVNVIAYADKVKGELPPQRGKGRIFKIFRFLTEAAAGGDCLARLCERLTSELPPVSARRRAERGREVLAQRHRAAEAGLLGDGLDRLFAALQQPLRMGDALV